MPAIHRPGPVNIDGVKYSQQKLLTGIEQSRQRNQPAAVPKLTSERDFADRIKRAGDLMRKFNSANLAPLLPAMLNLSGKPFTLDDHFVFEPLFSTQMPKRLVLKTGRQVAKSTSLAAQGILISATLPFFNTLFVTPLFELIRRFSSNYVQGFIRQSPINRLLVDATCNQNVLQRSFRNQSIMYFSFAFMNADRTRGLNCSKIGYDEIQDLDGAFLPIIDEVMSGSPLWGITQMAGTPKTMENILQNRWLESSQAEWHIFCGACNYENIPSLEHDLEKMIGPDVVRRKISEAAPGVVCAKCDRPVFPRLGSWVHHVPELRQQFAGYHVPQFLLPMHYSDNEKWAVLLGKRMGFNGVPPHVFYNEVCGESYDSGAKLVSQTEIVRACDKRENSLDYIKKHRTSYLQVVTAVDWGHGAMPKHSRIKGGFHGSFTVVVVLGLKPNLQVDILYGERFKQTHDWLGEARRILEITAEARASHIIHDYTGAGNLREHIMVAAGYPEARLVPVAFVRAAVGNLMRHVEADQTTGQRAHYKLDKARSLQLICQLIKIRQMRFFEYDHKGGGQSGLLHDFLSLVEDYVSARSAGDTYTIVRDEKVGPDDFAMAVDLGTCALYYMNDRWPSLDMITRDMLTPEMIRALDPPTVDWAELGS